MNMVNEIMSEAGLAIITVVAILVYAMIAKPESDITFDEIDRAKRG
jgi:hypothetical protein